MREYERRRAWEGELSEQDMPADLLADVEANQDVDSRSATMLRLRPLDFLALHGSRGQPPAGWFCYYVPSKLVSMPAPLPRLAWFLVGIELPG